MKKSILYFSFVTIIISPISAPVVELKQNYPNPFNPVTKIPFNLPKDGHVYISICNASGHEKMCCPALKQRLEFSTNLSA